MYSQSGMWTINLLIGHLILTVPKTALHYTALYNTILHYTILYYTILYYTILYYTILYYTILYYTILYYTIPALPVDSEASPLWQTGPKAWRRALETAGDPVKSGSPGYRGSSKNHMEGFRNEVYIWALRELHTI